MDSGKQRYQKTNPGAYPTPIPSGQDRLPFDQDAADVQVGPDVRANGQAASNGQQDGLAMPGADVGKPAADPFELAVRRGHHRARISTNSLALASWRAIRGGMHKMGGGCFPVDSAPMVATFPARSIKRHAGWTP